MKSVILYLFVIVCSIFVCSIESLGFCDAVMFIAFIACLGFYIYKHFSEEDIFKYSGYNYVCEKLGWPVDED